VGLNGEAAGRDGQRGVVCLYDVRGSGGAGEERRMASYRDGQWMGVDYPMDLSGDPVGDASIGGNVIMSGERV
jgi:hypothetical protein